MKGEPVMCAIISAGIRRNVLWKNSLDLTADAIGNPDNNDFFENDYGKGVYFKCFPRAPSKARKCLFSTVGVQRGL